MKLTSKGRYAVMALADLAKFNSANPVSLRDISLRLSKNSKFVNSAVNLPSYYYWNYDIFFIVFYTVECGLKILAYGLHFFIYRFYYSENAYILDNWNKLDFLIVSSSIIAVILKLNNVGAIKVLRVLRPLRSIQKIKSLKIMLEVIFSSFIMLKDTLVIMLFFFTVVSIAGL